MFLKVRKCAQESVAVIMKSTPGNSEYHPACQATTKFCIQELEKYKGILVDNKLVFHTNLQSVCLPYSTWPNRSTDVQYETS
jgi:hypothetical protein